MQKLIEGIHQFQQETFRTHQDLFEQLSRRQNPDTLFITCSDSRIDPNMLTQSRPGDLFILRNAGNIVPPHGAASSGAEATIEYAVAALEVKDIIICGHSHCGAMRGLMQPESLARLPAMTSWLGYAAMTKRIVEDNYGQLPDNLMLDTLIEENVLVQLENLRTLPSVGSRLVKGDLHLHGWVYVIETGEVFAYEPRSSQFVPLAEYRFPETEMATRRRTAFEI